MNIQVDRPLYMPGLDYYQKQVKLAVYRTNLSNKVCTQNQAIKTIVRRTQALQIKSFQLTEENQQLHEQRLQAESQNLLLQERLIQQQHNLQRTFAFNEEVFSQNIIQSDIKQHHAIGNQEVPDIDD